MKTTRPESQRPPDGAETAQHLSGPPEAASGVFRVAHQDDVLADMAFALHDAKNMACALQANLEWLESKCTERNHTDLAEAVEEMGHSMRALSSILVDALRTARSGGRALEVRLERLDLGHLVRSSAGHVRHRADSMGVRISLEGNDGVTCALDRELVTRVLDNLLDNALKASAPGTTVTIAHGRYGDCTVISVSDEGPGVSPEDQARIFELFVAGAESRGATGVGLAFCRRVAEAHGGQLTIDSSPGAGATFVLSLPVR